MKRNEKFHAYLFSLDKGSRKALAKKLGTSIPYLEQISYGWRTPSPNFAKELAEQTGIPKSAFRPDIWDAA